jgi:DNA-binding Lrp family transcriptional regulator
MEDFVESCHEAVLAEDYLLVAAVRVLNDVCHFSEGVFVRCCGKATPPEILEKLRS